MEGNYPECIEFAPDDMGLEREVRYLDNRRITLFGVPYSQVEVFDRAFRQEGELPVVVVVDMVFLTGFGASRCK